MDTQLTLTFAEAVEKIGFGMAVCLFEKDLPDDFWSTLTPDQKSMVLDRAISYTQHAPYTCGEVAALKVVSNLQDWLRATKRKNQSEAYKGKVHYELVLAATTFYEWKWIAEQVLDLKNRAIKKMIPLASDHRELVMILNLEWEGPHLQERIRIEHEFYGKISDEEIAEKLPLTEVESQVWNKLIGMPKLTSHDWWEMSSSIRFSILQTLALKKHGNISAREIYNHQRARILSSRSPRGRPTRALYLPGA